MGEGRAPLLAMPTGAGKSHVALALAKRHARTCIATPRTAIKRQLLDFAAADGLPAVDAGSMRKGWDWPAGVKLIVGGSGAIDRRQLKPTLLVIDEAHHAAAPDMPGRRLNRDAALARRVRDDGRRVVGMTATPWRLDAGWGFLPVFDALVPGPGYAKLIAAGWLAAVEVRAADAETRIEAGKLGKRGADGADFDGADVLRINAENKLCGGPVELIEGAAAAGRRTLVFAVTQAHAAKLAGMLRARGVDCGVTLSDGKREAESGCRLTGGAATDAFRRGELATLIGVGRFGEGYDAPEADCAVVLKPTRSLSLWRQMAGRLSRPGGRAAPILYDVAGNAERLGPPDADVEWRLESRNETARRAKAKAKAKARREALRRAVAERDAAAELNDELRGEVGQAEARAEAAEQRAERLAKRLERLEAAEAAKREAPAERTRAWWLCMIRRDITRIRRNGKCRNAESMWMARVKRTLGAWPDEPFTEDDGPVAPAASAEFRRQNDEYFKRKAAEA